MGKMKIDKREKASIRKKERRKERQRIVQYLNDARIFSQAVSEMSFSERFERILLYIDETWKLGINALIYTRSETTTDGKCIARWNCYKKGDWECIGDAAIHAARSQNLKGVPIHLLTEDMITRRFLSVAKASIGF